MTKPAAAQDEARAAGNTEIGLGHLVLGLLHEPDGLGTSAIVAQGVSLDAVRRTVIKTLPAVDGSTPELVPFDARAKKVLELTFREALRLEHDHVGTEHILLAVLELEDGTGVLAGLGVDKAAAEAHISAAGAGAP